LKIYSHEKINQGNNHKHFIFNRVIHSIIQRAVVRIKILNHETNNKNNFLQILHIRKTSKINQNTRHRVYNSNDNKSNNVKRILRYHVVKKTRHEKNHHHHHHFNRDTIMR
jgi:hypothetical protein